MHHVTGEIIWCYHRRLKCNNCGRTFAEIDPRFLPQFPTPVVERFPFLKVSRGLGMHQDLLFQFMHLATKGILFGTFCSMVNELKRLKYGMTSCSFYDALSARLAVNTGGMAIIHAELFPEYQSSGHYHGIDLSPRLIKHCFF
jgi:hypothetical protein